MIIFIASGFLTIGAARPLIQRRVKPNRWFGYRTPKTMKHEALWYDANVYMGKLLMQTGIAMIVASIFFYPFNLGQGTYTSFVLLVLSFGIIYMVIMGYRFINRYEFD